MNDELKKMLEEILQSVKALDGRITSIEERGEGEVKEGSSETAPSTKRKSIKEFLLECAPKNGIQTALAIGYFLETYEGTSPFNAVDLKQGFRAAREVAPANINDTANGCVKNGHMMEEPEKKDSMKAWVITSTGEKFLKNGFRGD